MKNERRQEERIGEWRRYCERRQAVGSADVEELEDHLRGQIDTLRRAGLNDDEAFLVAIRRLGDLDPLSREFATEHSGRLWKQLVVPPAADASPSVARRGTAAVGLAIAAAVAVKVPRLFGVGMAGTEEEAFFYVRNFSFFVLPFLAVFLALGRGLDGRKWVTLAFPFVLAAAAVNLMPPGHEAHTTLLTAIHLPIALWLTVCYAYAGGAWRSHERRMSYVRFSGEWLIYFVLIALGGGTLVGFTLFVFHAIGLDAEHAVQAWVLPCGVAGAVIVAAWLVESRQGVIENIAPVLTWLFTPLFAGLLLVFVATMAWTGSAIGVGREVLIGFDLLLVLVLALVLYSISARDPRKPPGRFDALQLLLVACALVVDALALLAIAARISEFGFSPNKTAALGLNLLLLVNLGWAAVLGARFLAGRVPFARLERWQTAYIPVFAAWAWIVALLFPVIFGYR